MDDARRHGRPNGAPDDAAVQAFMDEAKQTFPQAGWDARSRLNMSPDFSSDLDRFAEFLTLAGLLSLVVGGVGVANAAQGFVERKRATLAILKAIGATGSGVVALALIEFMVVALIGASSARRSARRSRSPSIGCSARCCRSRSRPRSRRASSASVSLYGLLTALVFSIAPLGRAHDLPVTTLIRDMIEERRGWPRSALSRRRGARRRGLVALAVLTSPQRSIATMVAGATVVGFRRAAARRLRRRLRSRAARPVRASSNGAWRLPPFTDPAR